MAAGEFTRRPTKVGHGVLGAVVRLRGRGSRRWRCRAGRLRRRVRSSPRVRYQTAMRPARSVRRSAPNLPAVSRDVDTMIQPQQQWTDRDCDRRQQPIGVTGRHHDCRGGERGDELHDGRDCHCTLNSLGLRTDRARRGPDCQPNAVNDHCSSDGGGCDGQGDPDCAADVEAAAHQPERGKRDLDETSDASDPLGPRGDCADPASVGGAGAVIVRSLQIGTRRSSRPQPWPMG